VTDTPRSLAEILTLFATNSTRDISAQDLRDAIVSIANPIPGGGFDGLVANKAQQLLSFQFSVPITVPTSMVTHPDLANAPDYAYDPMGAIQSGSYHSVSLGDDFGPGHWFKLPRGVWVVETDAYWDSNTVGDRIVEVIHIDDRQTLAGDDVNPLFGAPNQWQMLSSAVYVKASTLPANASSGTLAVFIVTDDMIAASSGDSAAGDDWAFALSLWQDSGGTRDVSGYGVVAARIA
jgi:hypothetical protein